MCEKQNEILEWLKDNTEKNDVPTGVISSMYDDLPEHYIGLYEELTAEEEFEILKAYADWGLSEKSEVEMNKQISIKQTRATLEIINELVPILNGGELDELLRFIKKVLDRYTKEHYPNGLTEECEEE